MPPRRTFGPDDSSGGDASTPTLNQSSDSPQGRRNSARVSFSALRKPSFTLLRRSTVDEETGEGSVVPDKPAIPSALQQSEAYTTPLPTLSMVVLSIVSVILASGALSCDYMRVPAGHARRVLVGQCLRAIHTVYGTRCVSTHVSYIRGRGIRAYEIIWKAIFHPHRAEGLLPIGNIPCNNGIRDHLLTAGRPIVRTRVTLFPELQLCLAV